MVTASSQTSGMSVTSAKAGRPVLAFPVLDRCIFKITVVARHSAMEASN